MTDPLYTPESEATTELEHLGYNASVHDLVVQAAHRELNRFLQNEGEAVQMWGWDPNSLHAADRYRIAQLLRSFIYQEQRIIAALNWLDEEYRAYVDSSPQARANAEVFVASVNQAAARRAIDLVAGYLPQGAAALWLTDDKRDRAAKDLVAKWQQMSPAANAHAPQETGQSHGGFDDSPYWGNDRDVEVKQGVVKQGLGVVAGVIGAHLKAGPWSKTATDFIEQITSEDVPSPFADRYLQPPTVACTPCAASWTSTTPRSPANSAGAPARSSLALGTRKGRTGPRTRPSRGRASTWSCGG